MIFLSPPMGQQSCRKPKTGERAALLRAGLL